MILNPTLTSGVRAAALILVVLILSTGPAALAAEPVKLPSPTPAIPQPDPADLRGGLAVEYWFDRFEHIRELTRYRAGWDGQRGDPLPVLDYQGQGNTLGTTSSTDVGAHITGLIHLDTPGPYTFVVTSNDGVRVTLGGVMIHEDPEIHPDTDSPPLVMEVATPGWYPLDILYYQKKGSSALKLWWQPPGATGRSIVPAIALKHVADRAD